MKQMHSLIYVPVFWPEVRSMENIFYVNVLSNVTYPKVHFANELFVSRGNHRKCLSLYTVLWAAFNLSMSRVGSVHVLLPYVNVRLQSTHCIIQHPMSSTTKYTLHFALKIQFNLKYGCLYHS